MSFVHLHLHSEYSLLDGACRIRDLPSYAKSLGQTALAITDHGVMYGAVDFYKECKKEGIKAIIGCEVYVAPRHRRDKNHHHDLHPYHLILLCRNEIGYRNLCYMVSCGFTEGFYHKPRVDFDLLSSHSEGLICLSACMAGEIPRLLLSNRYEDAKNRALDMQRIFGVDGYYLELQDHFIDNQKELNQYLIQLHRDTGIPLVATNDVHYLRQEDQEVQDILMCIQMDKAVSDPDRMRFPTGEFYLKSETQMRELFPHLGVAIDNTQVIADACQFEFQFGDYHLPAFPLPTGYQDSFLYLTQLCEDGFQKRYPSEETGHRQRLTLELNMIQKMGFVDYFLIVADFMDYAHRKHIPVGPGRGSAAGSMVSYCLYITDVDPMEYSLYFERFLNPERISMPDIDIDFCIHRRGEVIQYVNQKYGADKVAQIVTFGTLKARAAIRDVGRVLAVPYAQVDILAKLVPSDLDITLKNALILSAPLKAKYDSDATTRKLIDTAMYLEGMPKNISTHAAGVVVTKEPIHHYVPVAKTDKAIVTQFTMTTLEELGLLKMDFLGLRNLSVLQDTVAMIQRREPDITLDSMPDNDTETMDMISLGQTSGVFQMESAGMIRVCMELKPQTIEDLTAIIALYRPGPMDSIPRFVDCKHNPSHIQYKHPSLVSILSVTYGCIVYQEQVIEIFRQLGGYSLGQADIMRRAISKKKGSEIEKERHFFIHGDESRSIVGCVGNGIPSDVAEEIFSEIFDFANYAFNKAHAVCYAIIAYQTGYFKKHYSHEYMAALLTSVLHSMDKVAEYIGECRKMNIPILSPDINESEADFTATPTGIRFGLVAVKGIGQIVVEKMLEERLNGGKFTDFEDFCQRMCGNDLRRSVLESFIRCGSFDSFGYYRSQLLDIYLQVLDGMTVRKKTTIEGQMDLFATPKGKSSLRLPNIPEFSPHELMLMEKETTGLYLSGHPMTSFRRHGKELGCILIQELKAGFIGEKATKRFNDGQQVAIAGVITHYSTKRTKNQSLMAFVTVEDETGSMELLVFSRTLDEFGSLIFAGNSVMVTGKISLRDEGKDPQILVDSFLVLEAKAPLEVSGMTLYLKLEPDHVAVFGIVKAIISMFPGDDPIILYYSDTKQREQGCCQLNPKMIDELTLRLGRDNVKLK